MDTEPNIASRHPPHKFLRPAWNGGHIAAREFALDQEWQNRAAIRNFRFRGVVDWVDLGFETASSTNFWTLQVHLQLVMGTSKPPHVVAIGANESGAASRFIVRMQDPASFADLECTFRRLRARVLLVGDVHVHHIEVSVDAYSKRSDRSELQAFVLRTKLGLDTKGSKEIECFGLTYPVSQQRELRSDATLVIGQPGIEWHIYLKDHDRGEPIHNVSEHRARTEISLSRDYLPSNLQTFRDLSSFRFQSLTPYFTFRKLLLDDRLHADAPCRTAAQLVQRLRYESFLGLGHREMGAPLPYQRRKHHALTAADSELKERARDSLRELSRRFSAANPGKF